MTTVAVLDYGMGNLHSVAKALEHVGATKVIITHDPALSALG
jgi:glutamine amidotransferase